MLTLRGQTKRFSPGEFLFKEVKILKPNALPALTIAFSALVRGRSGFVPGPVVPVSVHPSRDRTHRIMAA
jgi:hypothetical protein